MAESRRQTMSRITSGTPTLFSERSPSGDGSKRFRDTNDTIQGPEEMGLRRPKPYQPPYAHFIFLIGTPLTFIAMGIGMEIAIAFSNKQGGFKVPTVNVFGTVSGQFLTSIIPTMIILPYAILYRSHNWVVRWFQPYITLNRGNASAEESLLLDYIYEGPYFSLFAALKHKHRILFLSTLTAFITYSFQPLAGSIFQIRQMPQANGENVPSLKTIALADANDINQLNGFLAAAGYVDAAALHGLGDPPFVFNNWTTVPFVFPEGPGLNATLTVNTTAISTQVNCANPAQSVQVVPSPGSTNLTFTSVSVEGCTPRTNVTFNPQAATQQYGVVDVTCPNAQRGTIDFAPVMFWFFHFRQDKVPEAKTVFCAPTILPFSVTATAHLEDGRIDSCTMSGDFNHDNTVTGPPNNGRAYNGLLFSPSTDLFIQARATAIGSGVPGTILRTATRKPEGLQAVLDLPNGMLDITSTIYTQHLTISAQSIYFADNNSTIPGERSSYLPRLWIDPLPGHFLALCLLAIGVMGLFTHFINYRQQKKLILAAPPGTIASITALTARSGFGNLLLPYDNEAELEKKLSGIKFRLDKRTGAIVADEVDEGLPGMEMGRNEAMSALLGEHNERLSQHSTSSQIAFQTASSTVYPPWVSQYKTPYERLRD